MNKNWKRLISREEIEPCLENNVVHDEDTRIIIKTGLPIAEVRQELTEVYQKYISDYDHTTVGVSTIGIEMAIYDRLLYQGPDSNMIIPINLSVVSKYKYLFKNARAEWAWYIKESINGGNFSFGRIENPKLLKQIFSEFGNIWYNEPPEIDKITVCSNFELTENNIQIPDIFNAYSCAIGVVDRGTDYFKKLEKKI